ncbi:MAG: redox-sensing transcriptional repressor Rex [Clostridia bacterium]|nr:redox-sensing transcriptional repressor Rex [Clostridia bacterium]
MRMKENRISASVIKRLPRYYRFLGELKKQNITRISSGELADLMKVTASQIRQDLNCFGGFGQQGYGYNIDMLYDEIGNILGFNTITDAIMIGVGRLGLAVAENMNFKKLGFRLVGAFDNSPEVVGTAASNLTVLDIDRLEEFCKEHKPQVAILCVPTSAAKNLSEKLINLGIKGFWNFTHYDITLLHPDVSVENVHLNDTLARLSYKIKNHKY